MLKAAAGGGGKGMRAVARLDGLAGEIESAMREAKSAFGYPGLIVEKLIERGRHIEVQIAGDGNGHVIHLFERECSLQRRHQKLIEEAPAANLPAGLRDRMVADAVRLGERLNYRGVGTVEFILSADRYYFLEVNPRLQVEHPVTEMVTGIDIVETMLRIAAGEGLPLAQQDVRCRGHAVEARLCAEDPANHFLPCSGVLAYVQFPAEGIRVETGVESGSVVSPYYDSMLAKLIAWAETRDEALDRLGRALDETSIFGITTNQAFLKRLIDLPATRSATFHTRLIDEQIDQLVGQGKGSGHRGAGAGRLLLDDAAAPARQLRSMAIARDHRMAHGGRRRRTVADSDPASRGLGRQRRDPVCAATSRWQHDRRRQRGQTAGPVAPAARRPLHRHGRAAAARRCGFASRTRPSSSTTSVASTPSRRFPISAISAPSRKPAASCARQ